MANRSGRHPAGSANIAASGRRASTGSKPCSPISSKIPKKNDDYRSFHDVAHIRCATPVEVETFDTNRDSMTGGWSGSLDKLEAYLGTATH
ncbi:MAG: hypothetical protein WAU86_11065 [Oricola sp.]